MSAPLLRMLGGTEEAWVLEDPDWLRQVRDRYACDRCGSLLPAWIGKPIDIVVNQILPTHVAESFGGRRGWLAVCRQDLLERLEPLLPAGCCGRVLDPQEHVITSHVTINLPSRAFRRGGPDSEYGCCRDCGTPINIGHGIRPPFMYLEKEVGEPIVQAYAGGVDCHLAVFERLRLAEVPNLVWLDWPIVPKPLDGMLFPGDDPAWGGEPAPLI